jgi:hypothetical protein
MKNQIIYSTFFTLYYYTTVFKTSNSIHITDLWRLENSCDFSMKGHCKSKVWDMKK